MAQETKREKIEDFLHSNTPGAIATNILIGVVVVSGVIVVAGVAPGVFMAAKPFLKKQKYSKKQMGRAYYNARKEGYIRTRKQEDGRIKITPTKKGRAHLKNVMIKNIRIPRPKKWDGEWRVVVFDVPVERSSARDALRFHMKRLGFCQLQKSVWVFPYECEEEILAIADFLDVEKHVSFMRVKSFSGEKHAKRLFGLT